MSDSSPNNPHPIDIIPPTTDASPNDMSHPSFSDDVPFWKPDWQDIMRQMGWRWILLLPAAGFVAAFAMIPFHPGLVALLLMGGGKLLILSIGAAAGVAGEAIRSAVRLRKDPFCIHCGYNLTGLDEGHLCPECGRPFSLRLIEEYRRDPNWFIKRYRDRKTIPLADVPFDAGPIRRPKSRDGT